MNMDDMKKKMEEGMEKAKEKIGMEGDEVGSDRSSNSAESASAPMGGSGGVDATMTVDPVCGMKVDPSTTEWTSEHKGVTYYFCSQDCKQKFDAEPEKYVPQAM